MFCAAGPNTDSCQGDSGGPVVLRPLEGGKHLIAVSSAKGGVGKSTVSANLAVALQRLGHPTGLLDADIYGPSVPMMMNTEQRPLVDREKRRILPVAAHGVRCLSMGLLADPAQAMIWRGPMVSGGEFRFKGRRLSRSRQTPLLRSTDTRFVRSPCRFAVPGWRPPHLVGGSIHRYGLSPTTTRPTFTGRGTSRCPFLGSRHAFSASW